MGRFVSVRRAVDINSTFMRVLRIHLSQRRVMTAAKVAILVGGPDWPTSVTVGILRLPLIPILIGTLPVSLLVVPLSLCGSFMVG